MPPSSMPRPVRSNETVNGRVTVVGSINADYVLNIARRPRSGETVTGAKVEIHDGGKGANQAVAVARCGARVTMIGCVGSDPEGERRVTGLRAEGIDVTYIHRSETLPTGAAFVTVTPDGENAIIVADGANADLTVVEVEKAARAITGADVLVVQLEIPIATVCRAIELAGPSTSVLLNCAPYRPLPKEIMTSVVIVVANEVEATRLAQTPVSSVASARRAARAIVSNGWRSVVITLGPEGAVVLAPDIDVHVPSRSAR